MTRCHRLGSWQGSSYYCVWVARDQSVIGFVGLGAVIIYCVAGWEHSVILFSCPEDVQII